MIALALALATLLASQAEASHATQGGQGSPGGPGGAGDWRELHNTPELVVHARQREGRGTAVNEMHAVGVIDADADTLWRIVRDVEGHTKLLPNTPVSRVLKREGDVAIVLQRGESALLDPREYVIAVREHSDGHKHTLSWKAAPQYASYVDDDAVRVDVNEGFWTVEPVADHPGRARITFRLLMDPAGYVPASFVNFSQVFGAQQALALLARASQESSSISGR